LFCRHSTETFPFFISCCVCFSCFSFFKLVTLLHFIRAIAPYGIHSALHTHTQAFSLLPSPSSLYSYSTLAARLIPRQSSFPSTFLALDLTYISTPYFTHIPILSSPGIYAEQLFFISIRALIVFWLGKPCANRDLDYNIRSQLWVSWVLLLSSGKQGSVALMNRTNSELSNIYWGTSIQFLDIIHQTMDNVQKLNTCNNIPSSQMFKSHLLG
jgi:hypothetical protein